MGYRQPHHILGFSPTRATGQFETENAACGGLRPASFNANLRAILRWHREPGHAGDQAAAAYIAERLQDMGYPVEMVTYLQYLRYPGHVRLEMLLPAARPFSFVDDPPSVYPDAVPGGFIAYAASGQLTGPVVYASFGSLADYACLRQAGIDPAGKIVMLRFGQSPDDHQTTTKVQMDLAEEIGVAGIIFYSDPAQDGFCRGPVYPEGPWRNATSVFRSNGKLGRPGDVRSPGWASRPGAPRLLEEEAILPRVPALSLAYGEAWHLLEALDGPEVPNRMQGGFPIPYRFGGGLPVVHMDVLMKGRDYPITDVVASVAGSEEDETGVYLGTHHDSWDAGAHDNAGGAAALLTVAESLATLLKSGWQPRRSLRLISFDAEEVCYGGATEYVEEHLEELRRSAVALMYVDGFTSGTAWDESFSPSMVPFLEDVLRTVRDPLLDMSLHDGLLHRHGPLHWPPPGIVDTLPFYHMAGVPCSYHTLRGENGVTHSPHDTLDYVLQQDPYHRFTVAQMEIWLRGALRLVQAELLPLDYVRYAHGYAGRLDLLIQKQGNLASAAIPLADLLTRYKAAAAAWGEVVQAFSTGHVSIAPNHLLAANALVLRMERDLLTSAGPQHAPWYRHTYDSPAYRATNYELATFPELTAALLAGDTDRQVDAQAALIETFTRATETLQSAVRVALPTKV